MSADPIRARLSALTQGDVHAEMMHDALRAVLDLCDDGRAPDGADAIRRVIAEHLGLDGGAS